jgi:D-apionolactonase
MASLSVPLLRCGGPANLPQSHALQAGPVSLLFEQGELRRLRVGDREVLRRIYLSVRGPDWSTIPPVLSELRMETSPDSFVMMFRLDCRQDDVDFTWEVSVRGNPEGVVRFDARGKANRPFATNRVGICVLHPLRECVGNPALIRDPEGQTSEGRFPETINPHQPFINMREILHVVEKDWLGMVYLEGEHFEMEDQRNWSDGSFKTYCPPQARPKPRMLEAGFQTQQAVTLLFQSPDKKPISDLASALAAAGILRPAGAFPVLKPLTGDGRTLPGFGFGLASHGLPMDPADIARIKLLSPFHLRADFRLAQPGWREELARATGQARLLSIPLECALVVPRENGAAALAGFAEAWEAAEGECLRWLVFSEGADATTEADLQAARDALGALDPLAAFARGSKGDFVLLNRNRPEPKPGMALAYAVSPQVHMTDNRTLVESLEGQAWTLITAAKTWPRSKVSVSPITLKRSPFSVALKAPPEPDSFAPAARQWRSKVDARQFSLFGAGWTLGSLKRMALFGAESATFFETHGLLGLMSGAALPEDLLQPPGMDFSLERGLVYPLWHVFADFAEFTGGFAYDLDSQAPLKYDAVLLHAGGKASILLANLEETEGTVRLEELGNVAGMRRLNEDNAMRAMRDPEGFRMAPLEPLPGHADGWDIAMRPFEYIRIDLTAE